MSIIDQLSRTKTKDEIADRKNRKESNALSPQPTQNGGTGNGATTPAATPQIQTTEPTSAPTQDESRGRDQVASTTTSSAPKDTDTSKLAPKRKSKQVTTHT